jgi:hypothetical protein
MSTDTTAPAAVTERPQRLRGPRTAPDGRQFTWGPVTAIHTVGNIQVVEYLDDRSNFGREAEWVGHGDTKFHPYIDGRDTSMSYGNLDSALVGAITIKRRGLNDQSARMFDLMTLGTIPGDQD